MLRIEEVFNLFADTYIISRYAYYSEARLRNLSKVGSMNISEHINDTQNISER